MAALWPADTEPPPRWWRTPVGQMVARTGVGDDGESVTQSVAAAMLGVTRGTVAQWLHRSDRGLPGSGGSERHPDGGITRASVLAKLAQASSFTPWAAGLSTERAPARPADERTRR